MDKVMPKCPGCGSVMLEYPDIAELPNEAGRYVCLCGWRSPWAETREAAYAAAMQRYVEPNRVLTLDEVCATLDRLEPVWLEMCGVCGGCWFGSGSAIMDALNEFHPLLAGNELDAAYGKTWRCWLRRPTDAERAAARWEGGSE